MYRGKPDVIRVLVIVFAVGLLVSGITSYASSENGFPGLADNNERQPLVQSYSNSRPQ
ncbi:MAG: hypothetical protein R3296_01285 [Oleiphilaceae bacterium]|nr:hypothetical protein [Oleiphilaceae bacterium]